MIIALAGFLAGSVHVLAGPDHLAAIAPLAVRHRQRAWLDGLLWGLGHASGLAVLLFLAWWLRELLPLGRIAGVSEQLVGVVLVGMGLLTLRAAFRNRVHVHEHQHDGSKHVHMHVHSRSHDRPEAHQHSHVSLWIGVLHGASGSAHLLAVLPAIAFPSRLQAITYLLAYAVGTVGAMVGFSVLLGRIASQAKNHAMLLQWITASAGSLAIVVGCIWLAGFSV